MTKDHFATVPQKHNREFSLYEDVPSNCEYDKYN